MEQGYTITEAATLLGIKRRTLAFYADSGFVVPEIESGGGRGTTRKYSRWNLFQFLLVRELNAQGVKLEHMERVILHFKSNGPIRASFSPNEDVEYLLYYLSITNNESENADIHLIGPLSSQDELDASGPDKNPIQISRFVYPNGKKEYFKSLLLINIAEIWLKIKDQLGD